MNFDNNFIDEKVDLKEAKNWIEVFCENYRFDYTNKDFERKMVLGLKNECKLTFKEISKITKISYYNLKKLIDE